MKASKDVTIGAKFTVEIQSRRWGHADPYTFERTKNGWNIIGIEGGACDKGGHPFLFEELDHDCIQYPHNLDDCLDWLWKEGESGCSAAQLDKALQYLAKWINVVETNAPSYGLWKKCFGPHRLI